MTSGVSNKQVEPATVKTSCYTRLPKQGDWVAAIVTAVVSPTNFYVQLPLGCKSPLSLHQHEEDSTGGTYGLSLHQHEEEDTMGGTYRVAWHTSLSLHQHEEEDTWEVRTYGVAWHTSLSLHHHEEEDTMGGMYGVAWHTSLSLHQHEEEDTMGGTYIWSCMAHII